MINPKYLPRLFDYVRPIFEFPKDTHVIIADDIQRDIDEKPKRTWTPADFPDISPTIRSMFIEAATVNPRYLQSGVSIYWQGLHILENTEAVFEFYKKTDLGFTPPAATRWVYQVAGFVKIDHYEICYAPAVMVIHVGESGEWVDNPEKVSFFGSQDLVTPELIDFPPQIMTDMIPFALSAISLMNSPTIVLKENPPSGIPKDRRYKTGKPCTKFYTLNILPQKVKRKTIYATPTDGSRPARAAHFRRGSWKVYRNEDGKRLLGRWPAPNDDKQTLAVFVAPHPVGRKENGEIKKRYRIKTH